MTTGLPAKDVVRDWFAVFNTGEVGQLERIHSADCHNHAPGPFDLTPWPPTGQPFGPDAAGETIGWIRANQPDLVVEIEHLLAEGDQVVAWIRVTGTPTGPGPMPPTGHPVDFGQAHRFRIRDGKIVEHWAVRDDLRSLVQAGVITPPDRRATGDHPGDDGARR